jgi:hypothetical protein
MSKERWYVGAAGGGNDLSGILRCCSDRSIHLGGIREDQRVTVSPVAASVALPLLSFLCYCTAGNRSGFLERIVILVSNLPTLDRLSETGAPHASDLLRHTLIPRQDHRERKAPVSDVTTFSTPLSEKKCGDENFSDPF